MLTLYYKPTCPYCQNVLAEAEELGVKFRLKDIVSDVHNVEELIQQGGKSQVPFLIDPERGEKLYESEDIIAYLKEHYAQSAGAFGGVRIHASDEICESCQ
jgi:glutathione S-transferase